MSATVDKLSEQYDELLHAIRPAVVNTPQQRDRYVREITKLMDKGEHRISKEEQAILRLLAVLVSDYEQRTSRLKRSAPHDTLRYLMRARGMQPRDMLPVLGSKGVASEILRGKRGISKAKAKALAEMFHVSAELFI